MTVEEYLNGTKFKETLSFIKGVGRVLKDEKEIEYRRDSRIMQICKTLWAT